MFKPEWLCIDRTNKCSNVTSVKLQMLTFVFMSMLKSDIYVKCQMPMLIRAPDIRVHRAGCQLKTFEDMVQKFRTTP